MKTMKLTNSLSRKLEEFEPRSEPVGIYTCGPTVYSTPTIGNFRTYVFADIVVRTLKYIGYSTNYVMNLTDVGHLTGDNLGDADTGEDRLEKAAKKEGKSAWDIASFYSTEFLEHIRLLNIQMPDVLCKATDHIQEQIEMVKKLEEKGFAYRIQDGIYFDTLNFEKMGFKYGELSTLDMVKEGARVEPNPEKKDPRDFALWKFSPAGKDKRRQMEWDSPWGVGFPGWHIECSAMSMKYLGQQFDIHLGGEDLRSTHHPNEIAQSEGATGKKPFVKYWLHGAFLLVDGGRMGKSLGNAYTVQDIVSKGYDPLALRYFYLTGHYRKQLNFSWEALDSASKALTKLRNVYINAVEDQGRNVLSEEKLGEIDRLNKEFSDAVSNDFDLPGALAVVWETAKSNIPSTDKKDLLLNFDQVLGLNLISSRKQDVVISNSVRELAEQRESMRKEKRWEEADKLRIRIEEKGYLIEDIPGGGYKIKNA